MESTTTSTSGFFATSNVQLAQANYPEDSEIWFRVAHVTNRPSIKSCCIQMRAKTDVMDGGWSRKGEKSDNRMWLYFSPRAPRLFESSDKIILEMEKFAGFYRKISLFSGRF